jgi:tetratricopeptide (TPR) repeat protein
LDAASFPPLTDFIVSVPRDKLDSMPHPCAELGRLDIIPVDEERDYYERLTALAMGGFQQDALVRVGSILHAWLKSRRFTVEVPDYYGPNAERTAAYDYVLVDSRTGVTETGGLCIGPLSDQLVVLTALNDQNVQGTRKFLEEVGILAKPSSSAPEAVERPAEPARRLDPKPTLIVASPVPAGEIATKRERLNQLQAAVGKAVVKLSYHPQMALMESIFTRDYRDEYLAREYDALLRQVLNMARDGEFPNLPNAVLEGTSAPNDLRDIVSQSLRFAFATGIDWQLAFLLTILDIERLREDRDFIVWDRVCRALSSGKQTASFDFWGIWANTLSKWSLCSAQSELARLRREAAVRCYDQVLQADGASSRQKAQALYNRGVEYGRLGDSERAITDYTAVLQMPDAPSEQKAQALVSRGWQYLVEGRICEAIEDQQHAMSLDPKNCIAHANLALALLADGQTTAASAAYDAALALANIEHLAEMTADLEMATQKYGPLAGADEVLARIKARRESRGH